MFYLEIDKVEVRFVVKKIRRSDYQLMRKIGTIVAGRWKATPRLCASGDTITCPRPSTGRRLAP